MPINAHKAKGVEEGREGGEVWGAMNDPLDCYLLLLHMWRNTWKQGDLRKLYVAGGKQR